MEADVCYLCVFFKKFYVGYFIQTLLTLLSLSPFWKRIFIKL